jgi:hypothetical protein
MLTKRLAYARDVAMPEDAEAAREEMLFNAVPLDVLILQEDNSRLGHRHPPGRTLVHVTTSPPKTDDKGFLRR